MVLPEWQRCYDYEAELVIVIGKPAWNVPKEQALACVFGFTCGNDLSARDSQFLSSQWLAGKSFPGFAPAGPVIVTADSFDSNAANGIYCQVNGIPVLSSDTSDTFFSCPEIVSTASRYFSLNPGDLIFTGTPSGVILGKDKGKRVWLKPGDVVQVTIDGIGSLVTPLVLYAHKPSPPGKVSRDFFNGSGRMRVTQSTARRRSCYGNSTTEILH